MVEEDENDENVGNKSNKNDSCSVESLERAGRWVACLDDVRFNLLL